MSVPFTERKPSQCVYLIDHMVCCGRFTTRAIALTTTSRAGAPGLSGSRPLRLALQMLPMTLPSVEVSVGKAPRQRKRKSRF